MHTSLFVFALALGAIPLPRPSPELTWWRDYSVAQERGIKEQKPLAVFVGAGQGGYHELAKEGPLNDTVKRILAEKYVCVYVDTKSRSQESLAKALEVTQGKGLILSDRSGNIQAFHHDGQISEAELAKQLEHFSAPAVEIRATLSNANQNVSYYPAGSFSARPTTSYVPAFSSRNC